MKIYIVIEQIDDYPDYREYTDAVFLNYINAVKYAKRKQQETDIWDEFKRITWKVETWRTADEKENQE